MRDLLSRMRVRHKLWGGFGIVLLILFAVGSVSLVNFWRTESQVTQVVDRAQPVVIASLGLKDHLDKANSALGFYLLSGEQRFRDDFDKAVETVQRDLAELKGMDAVNGDEELSQRIATIESAFQEYLSYREQLLALPDDNAANFPGVAYAAQNINPLSQQMLQNLSEAIQSEESQPVTERRRRFLMELETLRYQWANVMNGVRAFLAFRGDSARQEIQLYMDGTGSKLEDLEAYSDLYTFEQEIALDEFRRLREEFANNLQEMLAIQGGDAWRTDVRILREELSPILERIDEQTQALVDNQQRRIESISGELRSEVAAVGGFVLIMVLIGLIAGVGVAWFSGRAISRPLQKTAKAMNDVAQGEGDLSARLEVHSRDEVGELAQAFNAFTGRIQELVQRVAGAVDRLAATAQQTSEVAQRTDQGVQQQKSQTDQVATAMNEMATTVQEVSRNATQAAEAATEADGEAGNGRQVVGDSMEAIRKLADEVNSSAEVMQRLEQDSESIGSVLDVIRDIAEQTNLLALNAAIEAARAGEAGRGFAVVADEVRTLATRTHDSTQEIRETVEKLQNAAREAAGSMQETREGANNTVAKAGEAEASLGRITQSVSKINGMNDQIASSAEEQTAVAEDINRNVTEIASIADRSSEDASQLTASAEELGRLVDELKELVGHFRTGGRG
ncbi:methyl-accepting chemotaxis protein [Thiohalospira halophila DSM 15071]|uniref:Methyl-accepting chemotaxis protein n=1 Tax=Thiohalospira halophila DSM 15071 TaxID=1123397 RepID=A0A1I1WCP7_9GAMM|nr:methyl-accepting chemotaxis protein [Thiohalospira halophila]SFD90860.1 methyl-accepting chemotaxis protein [Thiohalospira halophila DSM 15071]